MRWLLVLALSGCVRHDPPITGTTSLKIDIVAPTDLGSVTNRLPDTARAVTFNVTALDAQGAVDPTFERALDVYVHYLGALTPYLGGAPLATVQLVAGVATNQTLTLPLVFGPTTLWVDDGITSDATYTPSYATGVSDTMWYRDPVIHDIEAPLDESAPNARSVKPLDTKNVRVLTSRYGDRGMLVVSSVYAQGYTIADVQCADTNGTPPCTAGDYDHLDVFSYSAARDQDKRFLAEGQRIDGFAGGVTEFDGLTEIGFPQTFSFGPPNINKAREPAPVVVPRTCSNTGLPCLVQTDCSGGVCDGDWCSGSLPHGPINFERNEGGPIEIDNAKMCNIDSDYTTFKQWKIDLSGQGGNCARYINVISAGVVPFDPTQYQNMVIPRVVGILRPINIPGFDVFIIYPRSMDDVTLP